MKIFHALFVLGIVISLFSCGNKSEKPAVCERTDCVDTMLVDTVEVEHKVQSRNFLRKWINEKHEVRLCAMSSSCLGIGVYGSNGYRCDDLNDKLYNKIRDINKKGLKINDITITDDGHWVVIYADNAYYGIMPQQVVDKLNSIIAKEDNLKLRSVSFNDDGEYIIVSDNHFYSSSNEYVNFYNIKQSELGNLFTATLCNKGAVFCFEYGMTYCGKIPKNVAEAISNTKNKYYLAKFTKQGDYVFASKDGKSYTYHIEDLDSEKESEMVENKVTATGSTSNANTKSPTGDGGGYYPTNHMVSKPQTCGICSGTGHCSSCYGRGLTYIGNHNHVCGACGGNGRCATCNGTGISGTVQVLEYY